MAWTLNGTTYLKTIKDDIRDREGSLYFISLNSGKRSITLNLSSTAGRSPTRGRTASARFSSGRSCCTSGGTRPTTSCAK